MRAGTTPDEHVEDEHSEDDPVSTETGTAPGQDLGELGATWLAAVESGLDHALLLRRRIHTAPEVSGSERQTSDLIGAELSGLLSLDPIAGTGLIGRIGPAQGPAVGIRAELDALPVIERTSADFASTNGAMHACGHDVHMAALVAVLRAVPEVRRRLGSELPVALAPVFQPREETYPSGALDILAEDGLALRSIAHMIGVHVHPGIALGHVAIGDGYINAAADEARITVHGRGGHGAYPHDAADPVAAISNIALSLPEIVRRTVGPMSAAVVSVGTIQVGAGAANVLPREGHIRATVRTTSAAERERLHAAIRMLANGIALAYGLVADVEIVIGEPVLLNDAELAPRFAARVAGLGAEVASPMRSLGADDFSYFTEAVPSVMSFVGTGEGGDDGPSLHDSTYLPPERAVLDVARTMIAGYLAGAESILSAH